MGGVIHFTPGRAAPDPDRARHRVYTDAFYKRKVYYQPVVHEAQAGAVAAAQDSEGDVVLAGKIDGGDHIRNVGAAHDHGWFFVYHAVVHGADFIVFCVVRFHEVPPQTRPKVLYVRFPDVRYRCIRHFSYSLICG